jgi:hypothetical protein
MNIVPSIVEAYSYAEMYNNSDLSPTQPEKVKAGGLPVNTILNNHLGSTLTDTNGNKMTGGGGPFENIVVPIGLVLNLTQPKRYVNFVSDQDDSNCKIDVLPDSIFDGFIQSVSKSSRGSSRNPAANTRRRRPHGQRRK